MDSLSKTAEKEFWSVKIWNLASPDYFGKTEVLMKSLFKMKKNKDDSEKRYVKLLLVTKTGLVTWWFF